MLYDEAALRRLMARLGPKIQEEARRIVAKGREVPRVRIREYVAAQTSEHVRDSLTRLMSGRRWRYVTFVEFLERLKGVSDEMLARVAGRPLCFVVDSLAKSSFWVVALTILTNGLLDSTPRASAPSQARPSSVSLVVDTMGELDDDDDDIEALEAVRRSRGSRGSRGSGMSANATLKEMLAVLPSDTQLVLMDDATYSGVQLSYFHDTVRDRWEDLPPPKGTPLTGRSPLIVAVPFMSLPSVAIFTNSLRKSTELIHSSTFSALMHRRTLPYVLSGDLYLETTFDGMPVAYESLYFDFLGILPTNTLIIFEHKFADALSIPNRWLQTGPCVPPSIERAFRVRSDRLAELTAILKADVEAATTGKHQQQPSKGGKKGNAKAVGWVGSPSPTVDSVLSPALRIMHRASRRLLYLMQSSRFRKKYMTAVTLTHASTPGPRFLPLIPPEYCDPRYQRYVQWQQEKHDHHHDPAGAGAGAASGAASGTAETEEEREGIDTNPWNVPQCRKPPYKRHSFRVLLPTF